VGAGRVPVTATLNGVPYRGSIVTMGGIAMIGVTKAIMEEAGVAVGDTLTVVVENDDLPREVEVPTELVTAFRTHRKARGYFDSLSYTHRREYAGSIAEATRPESRKRRSSGRSGRCSSSPTRGSARRSARSSRPEPPPGSPVVRDPVSEPFVSGLLPHLELALVLGELSPREGMGPGPPRENSPITRLRVSRPIAYPRYGPPAVNGRHRLRDAPSAGSCAISRPGTTRPSRRTPRRGQSLRRAGPRP